MKHDLYEREKRARVARAKKDLGLIPCWRNSNLYSQGGKGHNIKYMYRCKYAGNPLTIRENTIYNYLSNKGHWVGGAGHDREIKRRKLGIL